MSEMRALLRESAERLLGDLCERECLHQADQGHWPEKLWNAVVEAGFTSVWVSEESGGSGGDLGDGCAVLQAAGYAAAPIPLAETMLAQKLLAEVGLAVAGGVAVVVTVIVVV